MEDPMVRPLSALLCLALASGPAAACYSAPQEQVTPADELIARSSRIVLAKVMRAETGPGDRYDVTYSFRAERWLRGKGAATFEIVGHPADWEGATTTFDHHADPAFWEDAEGRLSHDTDCVIHPSFVVGGTYLVFLDAPYHNKSFEQVTRTHGDADTRDEWLQYVEDKVAEGAAKTPR
jgi:hypothetical protein